MTADEYKKLKPEHANLEGDVLWNAMEDYMLVQQAGQGVMKTAMPFFKRYQLRWLYYRTNYKSLFGKNDYTANKRCKQCKKGVSASLGYFYKGQVWMQCPHCRKELVTESNTNINHRLWGVYQLRWRVLDTLHLVRTATEGRYDMLGDEAKYVKSWTYNQDTHKVTVTYQRRKWWEYIFIERKQFNF